MKLPRIPALLLGLPLGLLAGCATPGQKVQLPETLQLAPEGNPDSSAVLGGTLPQETPALKRSSTPVRPDMGRASAGQGAREALPAGLGTAPVSINVDSLPVPAFANEVFGNLLGVNFRLGAGVAELKDLVTLRTPSPQSPAEMYRLARQVLSEYGVQTRVDDSILTLELATSGSSSEPPLILSGRALPDVPSSHRPVFFLLELQAIRSTEALRWLKAIYDQDVKAEEDTLRNALLLSGRPDQVRQAVEALQVFDRPFMRGRASVRLEPAFMSADELGTRLVEVLTAEGYGAAKGFGAPASVLALPIPSVNALIVFAKDQRVLEHAVNWARELDRPNPAAGATAMFYYQVRNTKASDIAATLQGSASPGRSGAASSSAQVPSTAPGGDLMASAPAPAQAPAATAGRNFTILVDEPRNALLFQGDPAEWERMLPLVRQMDRAARQVMIEVTIAEVTLDDNQEFGVSWFAKSPLDRFTGRLNFGTLPADGEGAASGGGLTYLLDLAGQNRALLRAFAEDERVSILSTPRLLVMSGKEASIDVGTEVPTLTTQTTSAQQTEGSSNLLQSIQYRKTGIILNIKPTVYSDDRIDLEISQEVSEALPLGDSSAISSPSIFNRSVTTSLSLRDGGSVILGGLMSSRETNSDSGVPVLKDVPLLGNLLKSQSKRKSKTELVLMIVPYVVGSDERAAELTRAISDRFELLELAPETGTLPPIDPER
jgi:general secretion pathway protein D